MGSKQEQISFRTHIGGGTEATASVRIVHQVHSLITIPASESAELKVGWDDRMIIGDQ